METRLLRPGLGGRIPFAILAVLGLALSIAALASGVVFAVIGVLLFGFGVVNAGLRLLVRRSYATELRPDGFSVFDVFGRPVHEVRWAEVEHLTVFQGNGLRGAGTTQNVAWRCAPRRPGHGRQPWAKGGVNQVGEAYDGALPDPYLGFQPMIELMTRYIEQAPRDGGALRTAPAAPFEAF